MADDKIRKGDPERMKKKKAPPPEDDEEEEERPRKRKRRDADEEESADIGSSPLSAVVPVGGSIWALLSFWIALLSCVVPLPLLGLIAVILGVVAFLTHKSKASYGSITGNMRAILGIVIGLFTMIGSTIGLIMFFMSGGFR
jgi:hypothetical protein